jgi:lipopolysaccharide/colanic/teichoic acid biosynthesis glycosyltransferase
VAWGTLDRAVVIGDIGAVGLVGPEIVDGGVAPVPADVSIGTARDDRASRAVKRTLDIVLAGTLLVLVSPLLVLLMLAVRLDSAGPALFRQVRVGKDGRRFEVVKLRTMVAGAEDLKPGLLAANECDGGVLFKIRHDPRITRVGAVLRRSSLDELPQLLNVLRGQMSLVGPRPALPDEVAAMDDDALRRFAVRPGMTGLWQVSGRSNLGWSEARAYDTYYADNWSVAGDIVILLRTVKAVVSAEGAC